MAAPSPQFLRLVDGVRNGAPQVVRADHFNTIYDYVEIRGNGTVFLGDSNTAGNTTPTAWGLDEWTHQGILLSQGRIRFVANAGVSGNKIADVLARLQSDVIALAPDRCIVMIGSNDAPTLVIADYVRDLRTLVRRLRAAGIVVILITVPPRNDGHHAAIGQINAAKKEVASEEGVPILDGHAVLTDKANGNFLATYNADDVHLALPGKKALAALIRDKASPTYPDVAPYLAQDAVASGPGNLITNGIFLDGNADGIGDSWSYLGSGGTQTPTIVAGAGDVFGNWQVLTTTVAGAARYISQTISTGYAVGDRLLFAGRLSTTIETGGQNVVIWCFCAPATVFSMQTTMDFALPGGVFAMEFAVPAGTTSISPQVIPGAGGTGTVRVAQLTLANRTQLSLV